MSIPSDTSLSTSTLTIRWVRPRLEDEAWEFLHHPAKQPFFQRHAIDWPCLHRAFANGALVPWPRAAVLDRIPITLSYHSYDDYLHYLAKARRNYRLNYNRMETELQRRGTLELPAPIVLVAAGEGLLFSGYRRLTLAWNYGMIPAVWRVVVATGSAEATGLAQGFVKDDAGRGGEIEAADPRGEDRNADGAGGLLGEQALG